MAVVIVHDEVINHMKSWDGEIGRSIVRLGNDTAFRQRAMANKRTGAMAAKISWKRKVYTTGIGFLSGSSARYTLYPDQGTSPHEIRPRTPGGQLVFYWRKLGRTVWLNSVSHPGNRGSKFLERGLRRALSVWERSG